MADFYVEPGLYTYSATPTWGTQAMDGDGQLGTGFVVGAITITGGAITNIAITTAGSGYNTNTRVYVSGTGTGAVISVASVDGSGGITGFTITNGGTGWSGTPTLTLVPGAATPATVSVDMTGWTFSTSSTVTVMGATAVTCTASATSSSATATPNAQYSATLTTMIDNLVTAINWHSGAVNTANLPSGWSGHQVRNTVYARRNGNALELMTRAGSRHYNGLTCLSFANVTGSSSQTWSGGKSGALGWLFNDSTQGTILPSAAAVPTYGCAFTGANTGSLALTASTDWNDFFHIRANNVTNTLAQNNTVNFGRSSRYLVDDGTVWVGDTGTYRITGTAITNPCGVSLGSSNGGYFGARTLGKLVIEAIGSGSYMNVGATNGTYERVLLKKESTVVMGITFSGGTNSGATSIIDCKILNYRNEWQTLYAANSSSNSHHQVEGCVLELPNFTGSATFLIDTAESGNYKEFLVKNCKVVFGATPSAKPYVFRSFSYSAGQKLIAENIEGCEIATSSAGVFTAGSSHISESNSILLQNVGAKRGFRLETSALVLDWVHGANYPYADSYLPDGTPWSYRFVWTSSTNVWALANHYYRRGLHVLSLTKTYISAAATRTIDLELLVPSAQASSIYKGALSITLAYVSNATGKMVYERSTPVWHLSHPATRVAIDSSGKSWTLGSVYTTHVARKLSITTSEAIKQNTEIEVQFFANCVAPSTMDVFINPELTIT